jgi:hypothetical protein
MLLLLLLGLMLLLLLLAGGMCSGWPQHQPAPYFRLDTHPLNTSQSCCCCCMQVACVPAGLNTSLHPTSDSTRIHSTQVNHAAAAAACRWHVFPLASTPACALLPIHDASTQLMSTMLLLLLCLVGGMSSRWPQHQPAPYFRLVMHLDRL